MKKTLLVLSAAAMVAAAAVPALAFENEFHGMFRLRNNVTNFQAAGLAGMEGVGGKLKSNALLAEDSRTFNVFEQRARLQYIAKASDDLRLVTFFEIDSSWGDAAYANGKDGNSRGLGAGAGGDSVNLETKNVYLDFNIPSTKVNMKLGLQPWSDAYKGIIFNNDLAGALATGKFDALTASAAFFRTYDQGGATTLGKKNVDLYVLDGKFAVTKDTTLGGSYYFINNDLNDSALSTENGQTHTIGLNAATKLGIVNLDAFGLYQFGDAIYDYQADGTTKDLSAWAAQIAASANFGMATVRGAFLYTSGDDRDDADESGAFQVVQENVNLASPATFTGQGGNYYSGNMLLLFRNVVNMDSDQAIVGNLNNMNHGVMAGFLGADFKVNDKFNVVVNAGGAWNSEDQDTDLNGTENGKYLGTEVNLNLNYKIYPNLTATLQGAYLALGKYYDDSVVTASGTDDPADPYLAGLMFNYTF